MPNLLLSLKNKKAIIFAFLFLFMFFPKTTQALDFPGYKACQEYCRQKYTDFTGSCMLSASCQACIQNICDTGLWTPPTLSTPVGPDNVGNQGFKGWGISDISKSFFVGIARSILWISWRFAQWIGNLFSTVMSDWTQNRSVIHDRNFTNGWTTVRDFSNMLVVLGFVAIGIATALRLREYEAKKLLPYLILVALLINFSGVFCGLLIDASNLAFKYFTQGSGSSGAEIIDKLAASGRGKGILDWERANNDTTGFITDALLYSVMYITVALTYIYLSAILIIRFAVLALLYILSPIAFTFWVFPPSKKLWTEWWSNFLKWCFVGVIGGFFLNIAGAILPTSTAGNNSTWPTLIIALLFMVVGFKMTAKSSGLASLAAGAVMGLAAGAAGFAMGAVAGGAKGGLARIGNLADRATGGRLSAAKEATQDRMARLSETLGGKTGSAAQQRQKRASDAEKQIAAMAAAPNGSGDRARYEQLVRTGRGALGAAAITQANKDGDLNRFINPNNTAAGLDQVNTRVAQAGAFGYKRKDFEDKNYQLSGLDVPENNDAIQRVMTTRGVNRADATRILRQEALIKQLPGMSGSEIRSNVRPQDITPELLTSHGMNAGIIRNLRLANPDQLMQLGNATNAVGAAGTPIAGLAPGAMRPGLLTDLNTRIANASNPTHPDYNTNEARRFTSIRNEILNILQP